MLIASFILIMINSILAVLLPKIMMMIIDDALPDKNTQMLINLLLGFLLIVVVQCGLKVLLDYICSKLGKSVVVELKNKLMNHIFKLDGKYYSNIKVGELITIIDSDIYSVEQISSSVLFSMISDVATAIVMFIFLIRIQADMVLVISIIQIFLLLFQYYSSKRVIKRRKIYRKSLGLLSDVEEEILSNIRQVILLDAKKYFKNKFKIKNEEIYINGIKDNMTRSVNSSVTSFLSGITTIVTLGYGGYKIINGTLELGELIAFNMYTQRIFTPIVRQIQSNLMIQQVIISLEKIFNVLDEPIKIGERILNNNYVKEKIRGEIEFKNVEFSYNESKKVLDNINLQIEPSKSIAIIGESGTGKTTIINLLYQLWYCNSGEILIDGKDIKEYDIDNLRKNISLVSQDGFIYNDTILNNLTLGNKKISLDEVKEMCKKVCIHEYIMSLPKEYNTHVGYRGDTLSGGQKQRLCIARAFLRKSPIIILDEITSALDKDIQEKVMENLKLDLKKSTCILITHRLKLLEYVDDVFELKDGRLEKKINLYK